MVSQPQIHKQKVIGSTNFMLTQIHGSEPVLVTIEDEACSKLLRKRNGHNPFRDNAP